MITGNFALKLEKGFNPPYMGGSNMSAKLSAFVKKNYPDSKSDLFACFIERCGEMARADGYVAMITQHAWMFLSSFENLRKKLLKKAIVNMAHLGARAFEEIGGEVVQTTSMVLANGHIGGYKGIYARLIEPTTQDGKEELFLSGENRFVACQENFAKIHGAPVAYWVSEKVLDAFCSEKMGKYTVSKCGMGTSDNNRFLRIWYEVIFNSIGFCYKSIEETTDKVYKWMPYDKGGEFRKWYGNHQYVVNFFNNGADVREATKDATGGRIVSSDYYFKKHFSWSDITNGSLAFRFFPEGFIFDACANSVFCDDSILLYSLGFSNTKIVNIWSKILNPTMHFKIGNFQELPFPKGQEKRVCETVKENVSISKSDWDSRETSWDFERHPLLPVSAETATFLSDCYQKWEQECNDRFTTLKQNEEELNRIFIDIYGLQDELTPEVEDKDVTVRKADLGRDIRSFISYAVGCMMGRYSLDVPGLAYAGGDWDDSKYKTILPDSDAILPICDDEYFDDDIVGRFVEFVKVVYGADALEENLQFVADALGGRGTSREVIRNYFLTGFYTDHVKTYQKRPIYWLFDSGKKNGFKCLVYMHRYRPDTIARIRTDYVHEQQSRYRTAISDLENRRDDAATTAERVKMGKRLAAIEAQAKELREYEEKIHHLADQMIAIDLDDGVKHNYAIFKDVLAKIK